MTNTFFMLAGLPGSGKSWQAHRIAEEQTALHQKAGDGKTAVWISSDAIRKELYGAEEIQGDSSAVFAEMKRRTDEVLRAGNDAIYDACDISSKRRRALLESLSYFKGRKVCVVCATPYQECVKRNSRRSRSVPTEVIRRMYMNWQTPFFFEGWEEIALCYSEGARDSLGDPERFAERTMSYEQDNPNHAETLGKHVLDTRQYILDHTAWAPNDNLPLAAILHDCGKPFTKSFRNGKGEITEAAHYYQHACVGAYDAMFFAYHDKSDRDVLEICTWINLHMNPFGWKDPASAEKQSRILGRQMTDGLQMLHRADVAASIPVRDGTA